MRKKYVKMVMGQVAAMTCNNFRDYVGAESFMGWLSDGEVWDDGNYTEEEIQEALSFAEKIAPLVDQMSFFAEAEDFPNNLA